MATSNVDKKKILKVIEKSKRIRAGYVHKGKRWLIGSMGTAYFCKDLNKGVKSRSYIICKPKSKKRNYNNIDTWKWYH